MVPSIDLQLQVAIKSLRDAVSPAVDPADKIATEQLQLVIATLTMARERLPVERRLIRRLLEDDVALAIRIAAVVDDGVLAGNITDAGMALADPELGSLELAAIRAELTRNSARTIAVAGPEGVSALAPIVVDGSRISLARLRSWCQPSGFEPDPAQLLPLGTLL